MSKIPYTIINKYPVKENIVSLYRKCSPALCALTFDQYRLFMYYASQQTGFAPAAKEIQKATGVDPGNQRKARAVLDSKRYIKRDETFHTITLNWDVVIKAGQVITLLRESESEIKETTGLSANQIFESGTMLPEQQSDRRASMSLRELDSLLPPAPPIPPAESPTVLSDQQLRRFQKIESMPLAELIEIENVVLNHLGEPIRTVNAELRALDQYVENLEQDNLMFGYSDPEDDSLMLDLSAEPPVDENEAAIPF